MWIAEYRESSNSWTHIAVLAFAETMSVWVSVITNSSTNFVCLFEGMWELLLGISSIPCIWRCVDWFFQLIQNVWTSVEWIQREAFKSLVLCVSVWTCFHVSMGFHTLLFVVWCVSKKRRRQSNNPPQTELTRLNQTLDQTLEYSFKPISKMDWRLTVLPTIKGCFLHLYKTPLSISNQAKLPAQFKHINQRRKRK